MYARVILILYVKKTESKTPANTSGNIYDNNRSNNLSNSVGNLSTRQRQLDEEMVENPVYGRDLRINDIDLEDQSIGTKN